MFCHIVGGLTGTMRVLLATLCLVACAAAAVDVQSLVGYHERVGIPMAERIKAEEDAIIANQNILSRIVGGIFATPNSHPYLGGLLATFVNNPGTGVCGAVLVSRSRLVTAAHCWFDGRLQANRFVVVLGSHFLFSGGNRIATSTVATHRQWNPVTLENDIAVIYLPNPVLLTSNIQPVSLPSDTSETFENEWALAVGYGKTSDQQEGVAVLSVVSQVRLQVISEAQCQAVYGPYARPSTVCTDGSSGVGICGGDSGGPLLVRREDGERTLIGITSFVAAAGCELGFPSGFTRVTSFLDFINLHLK